MCGVVAIVGPLMVEVIVILKQKRMKKLEGKKKHPGLTIDHCDCCCCCGCCVDLSNGSTGTTVEMRCRG